MREWLADYWWFLPLLPIGLALLAIFSVPAVQAKRHGYSFFVWLLAGVLVTNPIYLLVVLGVAPHRRRQKMREQFRKELDAKLAAEAVNIVPGGPIPDRSLGDQPTVRRGSPPRQTNQCGRSATRRRSCLNSALLATK